MRVDIRRFLGYGFGERLPVHQTISHAQTRRFVDAALFERLFLRSVALCREHGLIDGTHLSVDGFHVEADAALPSLRASLAPLADAPRRRGRRTLAGGRRATATACDVPDGAERPQLVLAEPRSGPTPRRRSSNASSTSRTDPDARLRGKPGQRPHLVHRAQIAVTPRRAASWRAWASAPTASRATRWSRSSSAPASPARSWNRSAPTRGSRPSASGPASPSCVSSPSCRPSARCCPPTATRRPTPSARRSPRARAARPPRGSGPTCGGWPTPRAARELKTSMVSAARAAAAPVSSTSNCCSAAPRSTSNASPAAPTPPPAAGPATAQADVDHQAAHHALTDSASTFAALSPIAPTASAAWTITVSLNCAARGSPSS